MLRRVGIRRFLANLLACFVFSFLIFNTQVSALELPACGGEVILDGDNRASSVIFSISLNCSNISTFVGSGSSSAGSDDLVKISFNGNQPITGVINGDILKLEFEYDDFTGDKILNDSLFIGSEVIANSDDEHNKEFFIDAFDIVDRASPFINNHKYEISGDNLVLDVAQDVGLLNGAIEYEGYISSIEIETGPKKGNVGFNPDGSFYYEYNDGILFGGDEFSYYIIDNSGNVSNVANVTINDSAPEIDVLISNQSSPESNYAKIGDILAVEISSDEPIKINQIKVCGVDILIEDVETFKKSFFINYELTDIIGEMMCAPSILISDRHDNEVYHVGEIGVFFDKTKPIIEIDDIDNTFVDLHNMFDLMDGVTACDIDGSGGCFEDLSDNIEVETDLNVDKIGVYEAIYSVVDRAGNIFEISRTINVTDSVNEGFVDSGQELILKGINNNLNEVTIDNYENYKNLYFETEIDSFKSVRIVLAGPIDLSNSTMSMFVDSIDTKLSSGDFGSVKFDLRELDNQSDLVGEKATIFFYNLNKLGYSNGSTLTDFIANMKVYDDEGNRLDFDDVGLSFNEFIGCSDDIEECYVLSFDVNHFTKFVITSDIKPPVVTIDKIKNHKIQDTIEITGSIDDVDANLSLMINDKTFDIDKQNIINNKWSFSIKAELIGAGDYEATIFATDFANNKSNAKTNFKIQKDKIVSQESTIIKAVIKAVSTPASIIIDSSELTSSIHTQKDKPQEITETSKKEVELEDSVGENFYRIITTAFAVTVVMLVLLEYIKKRL